jgi:hypothetical protein
MIQVPNMEPERILENIIQQCMNYMRDTSQLNLGVIVMMGLTSKLAD